MFEHVNIHSSVPVYQQIENEVRFAVASGRLEEGDQVPSVHEMSEKLRVNPNTVAKAYRDLEVMGLVFTRRGMGVYINKSAKAKCRDAVRDQIATRWREVVGEAKAAGMSLKELRDILEKLYDSKSGPYEVDEALVNRLARGKTSSS